MRVFFFTFVTSQVRSGLEELLFHLLILSCLSDSHGMLWRRNVAHLIAVEVLRTHTSTQNQSKQVLRTFLVVISICVKTVKKLRFSDPYLKRPYYAHFWGFIFYSGLLLEQIYML